MTVFYLPDRLKESKMLMKFLWCVSINTGITKSTWNDDNPSKQELSFPSTVLLWRGLVNENKNNISSQDNYHFYCYFIMYY